MPLADTLRPEKIEDIVGQEHLLGEKGVVRKMVKNDSLKSMILWGKAGIGKTTIARCLANDTSSAFEILNATSAKVADVRKIADIAQKRKKSGTETILFVDECLPYNTLILCKINDMLKSLPIGYIVENKIDCEVLSYNEKDKINEWQKISDWSIKSNKELMSIEIEDDDGSVHILECSEDHLIYTKNRGYVKACELKNTDELVDIHTKIKHGCHEFT
jgi:hypothetical protein